MRRRRHSVLLLLLLLLLPWSSGAADSSAGAPASAGEDPVAGKIRISEDYRQWAGTMASAMLLRANNDQAAGERELARLQAVTDKLLVNWEAGILPPQVAKLLAAEAAGAPAPAPEPGAAAGAALAAELSAPAAAPPQGAAADTDPAVMADALQRAGEGFAKAAADATASVSGAFADAAHALGLPAGAGSETRTNASYVQAGQSGSLARQHSGGAPPAAAEVTGEALQATGGTGVPPGGTEVQPPAAAPAVGPGGTTTGVHQYLGGALTVVDPQPFVDASARIISTLNAAVGTLSFVNFSPCVLVNGQAGIAAYAVGAVVEPTLIYIAPEGFSVASVGLSISPTAIAIGPGRSKTLAEGFAIAPTLISVAPVVDTDAQIGKDISGTPGKVVTLQRKPGDEPKATAGPGGAADQGQDEDEDASIVPRGARTGR